MRKQKIISLMTAAVITASGCNTAPAETYAENPFAITAPPEVIVPEIKPPAREHEDMPEDTPWNSGYYTVMEVETGYYINSYATLYSEKKNGVEIYLCPKPECLHNGNETCTATYKDLIRSWQMKLYNGYLYYVAYENVERSEVSNALLPINKEEACTLALYRIKLDGSALDRVGEIYSERDPWSGKISINYGFFTIHKGYAYVCFSGKSSAGIMRVDITNGKKEQIYYCKNNSEDPLPYAVLGVGDYIYFDLNGISNYSGAKRGTYRYSLIDGSTEPMPGSTDEDPFYCKAYNGDKVYRAETRFGENYSFEGVFFLEYDAKTGEPTGLEFPVERDNEKLGTNFKAAVYDDKMFVYYSERVCIYDMSGNKLAEMDMPKNEEEGYEYSEAIWFTGAPFTISEGKLYCLCEVPPQYLYDEEDRILKDVLEYVYCCPIEDIISGSGKWQTAYTVKAEWAMCRDKERARKKMKEYADIYGFETGGSI